MLWMAAAIADDIGGMRPPVETTISFLTPAVMFWVIVGLWLLAVITDAARLVERMTLLAVLVLLGARAFG